MYIKKIKDMKFKTKRIILPMVLALAAVFPAHAQNESKLLMTIGCITDSHTDDNYLGKDYLRGSIEQTLKVMKEQEDIDILVMGGDYSGGATGDATQNVWEKSRTLLVNATENVFHEGKTPYVVYANGNHEYMVGKSRSYNSGDYYSVPMKQRLGDLTPVAVPTKAPGECFYEWTGDGKLNLLVAYHYNVKGLDFVVLNTGKYLYNYDKDYYYSDESVAWIEKKLDAIYEADPDKTVFFVLHLPFGDSNSISSAEYGQHDASSEITSDKGSSAKLKNALAKHPGIIMLYGHDHKKDNAYIHERTSQRVTRYNASGKVISTTGEGYIDDVDNSDEPKPQPATSFYLYNETSGMYLNMASASSLQVSSGNRIWNFESANGLKMSLSTLYNTGKYYLSHNGTSFVPSATASALYFFDSETGHAVQSMTVGSTYYVVAKSGSKFYILRYYNGKLEPKEIKNVNSSDYYSFRNTVGEIDSNSELIVNPARSGYSGFTVVDASSTKMAGGSTKAALPATDPTSFISVFMGSMDFWDNIPNGNSFNRDMTDAKNHVYQALMIYVYNDRIVFKMKNYGKTGTFSNWNGSVTVKKYLIPYTVMRNVKLDSGYTEADRIPETATGTDGEIFDTAGRKVNGDVPLERGLYIMDGKTYYVE